MKKDDKKVKGKYPSKGMNALARKNPKVAKKIMGYEMGGRVKKAAGGIITADKRGQAVISRSDPFPKAQRAQVKGFGAVRPDVKNFRKG